MSLKAVNEEAAKRGLHFSYPAISEKVLPGDLCKHEDDDERLEIADPGGYADGRTIAELIDSSEITDVIRITATEQGENSTSKELAEELDWAWKNLKYMADDEADEHKAKAKKLLEEAGYDSTAE